MAVGIAGTANAQGSGGGVQWSGDKISIRESGVRLDGNAVIKAPPQLEVRADAIAFDAAQGQITEVRAIGRVNLKVSLTPKGGGKATRIETVSDGATLKPQTRELTLTGNVDGFFQPEGQARTTLAGTKVVMNYVGAELNGMMYGPIKLVIPGEAMQGSSASPTAIGAVTITAREGRIDGRAGVVRFVGDARAVSDGPNQFQVSASEFVLTRNQADTIETLTTTGRTRVIVNLPPEPAAAGTAPGTVGRPTRVEAEADSAVVNRATNTLNFDGNVIGYYLLAPAGGEPQKYDFTGNKATIRYVPATQANAENPAGLRAEITGSPGKPVEVLTPAFNFNLGN